MKIIDSNLRPGSKRSLFLRLLDRLFFYESMSGNGACPVYLERWTLLDLRRLGYGVYLHHFIGDDWAADPHDHPRRFVSIGLWGWYWEHVYPGNGLVPYFIFKHAAPWFRTFPAHHLHRVCASECDNCWTFVIVFPKSRAWGFVRDGVWMPFREYVFGGKSRKSC